LPDSLAAFLSGGLSKTTGYRTMGYVLGRLMPADSSDDRYLANDGLVPLASSLYLRAPASGENESLASETSSDEGIGVSLSSSALDALKPPVLAADAVQSLHFAYPTDSGVYDLLSERLAMPDACDGDANHDGRVTVTDAQFALRMLVGLSAPTGTELLATDCDRNGAVSLSEVTRVLRIAVGL
jgi:hypothetical protein